MVTTPLTLTTATQALASHLLECPTFINLQPFKNKRASENDFFSVFSELCYTLYTALALSYISNLMLDLGILSRGQIYKASQTSDLLRNRTINHIISHFCILAILDYEVTLLWSMKKHD